MGKETADGLRLIDTDKLFASLAGRLDDEVFLRVAAAFGSCINERQLMTWRSFLAGDASVTVEFS